MSLDEIEMVMTHLAKGARFECFEQGGGVSLAAGLNAEGRPCWVWTETRVSGSDHFERDTETLRFDDASLRAFLVTGAPGFGWLMGGLVARP
jgi:hypothetical protein